MGANEQATSIETIARQALHEGGNDSTAEKALIAAINSIPKDELDSVLQAIDKHNRSLPLSSVLPSVTIDFNDERKVAAIEIQRAFRDSYATYRAIEFTVTKEGILSGTRIVAPRILPEDRLLAFILGDD